MRPSVRAWLDETRHAAERVRSHAQVRGPVGAARLIVENLLAKKDERWAHRFRKGYHDARAGLFDLRFGVDTRGILDSEADGNNGYEASPIDDTLLILRNLPVSYPECTVVDIGSGKGRVVLLAARFPFKRVVGVEVDPELSEVAARNLARVRERGTKCRRVELVQTDVVDYPWPAGPLVLYMFNPMAPPLVAAVLERVRASFEAEPRPIWVVYYSDLLYGGDAILRPFVPFDFLRPLWDERARLMFGAALFRSDF